MSRTFVSTLIALAIAAPAMAFQQTASLPQGRAGQAGGRGMATTPTAQNSARAMDSQTDSSDANITVTITVTDKGASGAPVTRSTTVTFSNQGQTSARGLTSYFGGSSSTLEPTGLDLDAGGWLRKSGMVRANLTVAFLPAGAEPKMQFAQRQSFQLFLKPGETTTLLKVGDLKSSGMAQEITAKVSVSK